MRYYQNEETGRTVCTDNLLNSRWFEITKKQYEQAEKATTDRITLRRDGFQNLVIRKSGEGWEVLEYTDRYGGETWREIDTSEFDVEAHIEKYGSLPKQ